MPGFDSTGPNGQGSLTGRGQGNCPIQGTVDRTMMRRRRGRGFGVGGRGSGIKMRNRLPEENSQTVSDASSESMKELQDQIMLLKEQVAELISRSDKIEPANNQKA